MIPKDPAILLSCINTKLRDFYGSLDELCSDMELDRASLENKLNALGYRYSKEQNQFI